MRIQRMQWLAGLLVFVCLPIGAQSVGWPKVTVEARPAARWWWMGSAVDKLNLTSCLEEYNRAGMGTMEITPIYGVKGNESKDLEFLSQRWMEMFAHTEKEASRLGMQVDMNTGTGWPFGGPQVGIADAATKVLFREYTLKEGQQLKEKIEPDDEKQKPYAIFNCLMAFSGDKRLNLTSKVRSSRLDWKAPKGEWRLIAVFSGKTLQKVKRAAPGGEGYVMDHLSAKAVSNYLKRFDKALQTRTGQYAFDAVKYFYRGVNDDIKEGRVTVPHNFFNDSYEVYKADWTPAFLEQFAKRRGYKLEEYLPEFLDNNRTDTTARIISDYRETMAELLKENFTEQWTKWAHDHGSKTRNQAHGSPGNLIDLYATVDVPECEGFGISDFHIKGLRKDSMTRPNDSDLSMLKYASSAAHIAGKPFTSAETFTWLTNHFRTSLSQCKPDLDLMFVSGVNHTYIHGTTYSPAEAQWPGWKFYASIDMSPTNSIWRDAPAFFSYVTRCQSFLQMGKPDNDFLIYLPVYDMWYEQDGRMLMFDIHKMAKRAPKFIDAVHQINDSGYDVDYISDNFIRSTRCLGGKLLTEGGAKYKAIIVPAVKMIPADVLEHLMALAKQGATVIFADSYPQSVPGFAKLQQRTKTLEGLTKNLPDAAGFNKLVVSNLGKGKIITGKDYGKLLAASGVRKEEMKTGFGLQCIRRSNEAGYHYFVASLQEKDVNDWITLGVDAASVMIYDPLTGQSGKAKIKHTKKGTQVLMDIKSGQSLILKTFTCYNPDVQEWKYKVPGKVSLLLEDGWTLRFVDSYPRIDGTHKIGKPAPWTGLDIPDGKRNMGTGVYSLTFDLPEMEADSWLLDLGDVRESARVRINGTEAATLWSVPFVVEVGGLLKPGSNQIEVEVTNLPANRISDYDRSGKQWRIFKDANMVDINYNKDGYAHWDTMPSGLMGNVKLIPVSYLK